MYQGYMSRSIKENRRKKAISIALHIIGLLSIIAVMMIFAYMYMAVLMAPKEASESLDKGYVSYKVKSGDTLSSVAVENLSGPYTVASFIDEVVKINDIHPDQIYAGYEILLPVIKEVDVHANY